MKARAEHAATAEAAWAVRTGWTRAEFRQLTEIEIARMVTLMTGGNN